MDIKDIAKDNQVKFLVLFGSVAIERQNEESDIDIAVFCDNFNDIKKYNRILSSLSEVLKIKKEKIDLTDLKNADPLLRYEVISKGKLLFGEELDYLEFCAFANRDYFDSQELFNMEMNLAKHKYELLKGYAK